MTSDLATVRDTLEGSYRAIESLAAGFGPEDWLHPSLCPDWTVRAVASHLAAVEQILTGWLPTEDDQTLPFGEIPAALAELNVLDDEAFTRRIGEIFDERRRDLERLTEADLARPSMTPVGPGTYGRFMEIRVFDFWVHERDMAIPLRRPVTDETGPRAELALAEVRGALGYIVGKKIGLPDKMSIVFHLTGPLVADLACAVDGRAKVVESLEAPDVEVTTDTTTFMLLACGRVDPQEPIDFGAISWTGPSEWGERAARELRFTM